MPKKLLNQIYEGIYKIITFICVSSLIVLVALVFVSVVMRYVFSSPIRGAQEFSIYLLLWFGFLGIIKGHRDGNHISITFFVDKLPEKGKKVMNLFSELMIMLFSGTMFYQGLKLYEYNIISPLPATNIPSRTLAVLISIVGIMLVIQSTIKMFFMVFREGETWSRQ
ncbi:TRAP-type C4-dicarboxylate transport system permease small subunit [Halanaerobium saccharolyticum]|uniref:TRAP-type C4-dicarboxylate transport system permease small subunit n=1 Tax=Halanaerobium saccharolyticum TaxID=43595 RepID=A0A4R6LZY0_9FIRM|nr:TRAP transporter small permease [Halanaerobium saccharolyticum]TDO94196.1 TRAP-type C4-dicarboxylate transport system permease small subunit [Halanaerobium saccharolyticum]